MGVRENKVERYLHDKVVNIGGWTEKWGTEGNPDRVVFYNGKIYLVEVKTTDGKLTVLQQRKIPKIESTGVPVKIVKGHTEVDKFIEWLKTQ